MQDRAGCADRSGRGEQKEFIGLISASNTDADLNPVRNPGHKIDLN